MATKKCPVCGWDIKDQGHAVKVKEKTVVVCCEDCVKEVEKSPAKYAGK